MVNVLLATKSGAEWLADYQTATEAMADTLEHWNEEEGPQLFYLVDDEGRFVATMLRADLDPEVCITTLPTGQVHQHRCRYILDHQGRYASTEVVRLN